LAVTDYLNLPKTIRSLRLHPTYFSQFHSYLKALTVLLNTSNLTLSPPFTPHTTSSLYISLLTIPVLNFYPASLLTMSFPLNGPDSSSECRKGHLKSRWHALAWIQKKVPAISKVPLSI